jgi:hypothetical protein
MRATPNRCEAELADFVAHRDGPSGPSFISARDQRWQCRSIVEVASSSFDPDRAGVGSSPYVGDMAATGVRVPSAPTTSQSNRYLIRLAGVQIPSGCGIILHGLRQGLTIRCEQANGDCGLIASELEVTSPFWSFPDGNVSWHLRVVQNVIAPAFFDPTQQPGTDPNLNGLDSALLYRPPLVPYTAPNAGIPPGATLDWLDTWRDMRFPWENTEWRLHQLVRGPNNLVFYASVHQPNPEGRVVATPADPGALRPEDRFLATFQQAIYGRVAGAMTVELLPDCSVPL